MRIPADEIERLLIHYDADWRRLWWLRIDGRAEQRRGERAVEALRCRYPQTGETPVSVGEPTLLRIEPVRITSWVAGGLSSTA